VTITARSTLTEVAIAVARARELADIPAVLTGGACATIYSKGAYMSSDLDFILRGGTRKLVDEAMAAIGFTRKADHYVHRTSRFFVEFPRGPLAIGDDFDIAPVKLKIGRAAIQALSATDSCRDRLAAFYHWSDRQSLEVAVEIAVRQTISLPAIRRWSEHEGYALKYEEFVAELRRRKRTAR